MFKEHFFTMTITYNNIQLKEYINPKRKIEHEFVSMDELHNAYEVCLKRKKKTINAMEFTNDLYTKLYNLYIELNQRTYEIGNSIAFCVDEPVKREVFAADFRDRIVHHLVMERIGKYFEENFIYDSYSCRVGKGTEFGVQCLYNDLYDVTNGFKDEAWIIKCDLKSFFMTISKERLYNKLETFLTKCYKEDNLEFWLDIIHKIVFDKPQEHCIVKQTRDHWDGLPKEKSLFFCQDGLGLPIGNLTSQIFANFYLSEFDHWIQEDMGIKYYGRYVDDFYILLPIDRKSEATPLINKIREKLDLMGVILHPNKTYQQSSYKGVKFIGSVVKHGRIYIADRTKGHFFKFIEEGIQLLKHKPSINNVEYVVGAINSYLGFMRRKKTFNIRYNALLDKRHLYLYNFCYPNLDLTKLIICSDYRNPLYNKKEVYSSEEIKTFNYIENLEAKIINNIKYNKVPQYQKFDLPPDKT